MPTLLRAICVLMVLLGLTCPAAPAAEDAATAAKRQAEICGEAILHADYDLFVTMIHPRLLQAMGGKIAVIRKLKQGDQQLKAQGSSIQSITMGDVTQIRQSKTETFAVVPETIEISAKDGVLRAQGFLLGISSDGGKTWRFIDGDGVAGLGKRLRALLPNLPADMQLPRPTDPTFEPAKTDAPVTRQEPQEPDSVDINRSFYTAKLPKGSNIGLTNARTDPDHGALVTLPNGNPLVILVIDDRIELRTTFNEILGSYRTKLGRSSVAPSDLFNDRRGSGRIASGTLQGVPYCFEGGMFSGKTKGFIMICGYQQAQSDQARQMLRQVLDSFVAKE